MVGDRRRECELFANLAKRRWALKCVWNCFKKDSNEEACIACCRQMVTIDMRFAVPPQRYLTIIFDE
jgi:hypothetical protein